MSSSRRLIASFAAAAVLLSRAAPAAAQSLVATQPKCEGSVCESRQPEYFLAHGASAALLGLGVVITGNAFPEHPPLVRALAPEAHAIANAALTLELVVPVPVLLSSLNRGESFDAAFMYGEALLGASLAEHLLRPASVDTSAVLGFSGAVASAYLFDQSRAVDLRVQGSFWALQLGLATTNACFNVRAGRRSGLATLGGAALGTALGVLAQGAHSHFRGRALEPSFAAIFNHDNQIRYGDYRDHVWALSAGSMLLGGLLAWVVPRGSEDPNLKYQVTAYTFGNEAGLRIAGKL